MTSIKGLELFEIDIDELSQYFKVKCASSVSVSELEAGKVKKFNVVVQGQQADMIEKILVEKYKIPRKYLNVIDNCDKKKKK